MKSHWFPLIRPAIKPFISEGGTLGGCRLISSNVSSLDSGSKGFVRPRQKVATADCFFVKKQ